MKETKNVLPIIIGTSVGLGMSGLIVFCLAMVGVFDKKPETRPPPKVPVLSAPKLPNGEGIVSTTSPHYPGYT
jgi:hypothetical protein